MKKPEAGDSGSQIEEDFGGSQESIENFSPESGLTSTQQSSQQSSQSSFLFSQEWESTEFDDELSMIEEQWRGVSIQKLSLSAEVNVDLQIVELKHDKPLWRNPSMVYEGHDLEVNRESVMLVLTGQAYEK